MIARVWRGWAALPNAVAYETHFRTEVLPHLKEVRGFRGADLLRREDGAESEFVVVSYFESLDAVRDFAGDEYERAIVAPEAQQMLSRFEQRATHYEVLHARDAKEGS